MKTGPWPQNPSARHQAARPAGIATHGLGGELNRRFGISSIGFSPDAYRFEERRRVLRLFEVIVTHPLTLNKLQRIRLLDLDLDCYGWRVRLVGSGSEGLFRNVDLETGRLILSDRELGAAIALLPALPSFFR